MKCLLISLCLLTLPACRAVEHKAGPAPSASAAQGPRLTVKEPVFDFGPSVEGEKLKHTYVVTNAGTSTLLIDRVDTSCGCTAALLKSREVAPGASTEVELTFDTVGRPGANHKTVTLVSNDSASARYMLEFKTIVESLISVEPRAIFKTVDFGSKASIEAWLIGKSAEQAKLSVEHVDNLAGVSVETTSSQDNGKSRQGIKVSFSGTRLGSFRSEILLATGLEKVPRISVPVTWIVSGNIETIPRALSFNLADGTEATLQITSKRGDYKLRTARILDGPFTAAIVASDASTRTIVSVRVKQDGVSDAGLVTGTLELLSNDPVEPAKTIPLQLSFRPKARASVSVQQ